MYYSEKDEETGEYHQRRCFITTDRDMAKHADALIFHSTDLYRSYRNDMPTERFSWQNWIFFTLEPPQFNRLGYDYYRKWIHSMKFNYTMSYSRFSDIQFPYGRTFDFPNETQIQPNFIENVRYRIENFVDSFQFRPKDAVWIVSDCDTMGKRENIVSQLVDLGMNIDTWGTCWDSMRPDQVWKRFGTRRFFQQYRFYLAFENALCEEYLTEKAFLGLHSSVNYGLIPIVYGYGNYSEYLPHGSYIDATKFPNATSLYKYLTKLTFDNEMLESFYRWQYHQYIPNDKSWRVQNGLRNLCRQLHAKEILTPKYESVVVKQSNNSATIKNDVRSKIGACLWTADFNAEKGNTFQL